MRVDEIIALKADGTGVEDLLAERLAVAEGGEGRGGCKFYGAAFILAALRREIRNHTTLQTGSDTGRAQAPCTPQSPGATGLAIVSAVISLCACAQCHAQARTF